MARFKVNTSRAEASVRRLAHDIEARARKETRRGAFRIKRALKAGLPKGSPPYMTTQIIVKKTTGKGYQAVIPKRKFAPPGGIFYPIMFSRLIKRIVRRERRGIINRIRRAVRSAIRGA